MTDVSQGQLNETAPPPPPANTDTPPDVVSRGVPDAIEGGTDEQKIRASVRELNKQRDATGEDPFAEQHAPILERKYHANDKSQKTLRAATADLSERHLLEKPEAQLAMRTWNWSEDKALEIARDKDYLMGLGYTPLEADRYSRSLEPPPVKISPVRDDGRPVKPLNDDEPIGLDEAFKSRSELKRSVKNFRQAAAEAQQRILAELSVQDQISGQSEQPAAPGSSSDPAVSEPAQPAPQPQADPVTLERGKLEAERRYYNEARRFSTVEVQAQSQIEALVALTQQNYPELWNRDALAELQRTNPTRYQQAQQANAYLRREVQGAQQKWQQARASRQAYEGQIAQLQTAEIRARWHQYKDAEDSKFHQFTPEMNDPVKASAMRLGVQAMLYEVGFGKEELHRAWNGESGFSVRDHRAQRLIADAYRWRQAQANARDIANKRAPVPPVVRPGTFRPAGADGAEQISRIERELESATGARAVKLATQLHRARRSAGY
jgi:hypothetical protein